MATYTVPAATTVTQNLPVPGADAYVQPVGGSIYISQDATLDIAKAGIIPSGQGYPIASGAAWKYRAVGGQAVSVRMWDK